MNLTGINIKRDTAQPTPAIKVAIDTELCKKHEAAIKERSEEIKYLSPGFSPLPPPAIRVVPDTELCKKYEAAVKERSKEIKYLGPEFSSSHEKQMPKEVFTLPELELQKFQDYTSINSLYQLRQELNEALREKPITILMAGSDARDEANPQKTHYEFFVIYDLGFDQVKTIVSPIFEKYALLISLSITEWRDVGEDNLAKYQRKDGYWESFPVRCLDTQYFCGEENIFKSYKASFLNQVRSEKSLISSFRKSRVKEAIKNLKAIILKNPDDGIDAKELKYSIIRAIQYSVDVDLLKLYTEENASRRDVPNLETVEKTILERIRCTRGTSSDLESLYSQALTSYHFLSLAESRGIEISADCFFKELKDIGEKVLAIINLS